MRRRVYLEIDRVTVDASLAGDPAALKAAIEQAVTRRMQAPGALDRLAPHQARRADAGIAPGPARADAIGAAVAATLADGGKT